MRTILRTSNIRNYSLIKLTALVWIVGLLIVMNACGGNSETENSSGVIDSSDSVLIESGEMPAPEGSQGEFVLVDEMKAARQLHSAIKLPDGRIFVVGGRGPGANLNNTVYETAELYNPDSDEWTLTGSMVDQRHDLCASLLQDGKVLAAGGRGKLNMAMPTAEVWDPETGEWSQTENLNTGRDYMPCLTLNDGRVMIIGGEERDYAMEATAEIWDPSTGKWSETAPMSAARARHTATLLDDGRVLITGGGKLDPPYEKTSEIYDPSSDTWLITAEMSTGRASHSAVKLSDGNVLIVGGRGKN